MRQALLRILAVWISTMLLVSCGDEQSPEAQIRSLVDQFEQAIESRSLSDASDLLADHYRDDYHANKAAAMRVLFAYTRRQRALNLFTLIDSVDVDADATVATAVVHVAVTSVPVESAEALFSLNADLYRFDVGFTAAGGDWRIDSAKWRRVDLGVLR